MPQKVVFCLGLLEAGQQSGLRNPSALVAVEDKCRTSSNSENSEALLWDGQLDVLAVRMAKEIQAVCDRKITFNANSSLSLPTAISQANTPGCPQQPFLHCDVAGNSIWMNVPFSLLSEYLKHYMKCKLKQSLCFLC